MDEREQFLRGLVGVMDDASCAVLRRLLDERLTKPGDDFLVAEERELIKKGDKIEAIKSVRYRLKCDLRMAKDIVDRAWGARRL